MNRISISILFRLLSTFHFIETKRTTMDGDGVASMNIKPVGQKKTDVAVVVVVKDFKPKREKIFLWSISQIKSNILLAKRLNGRKQERMRRNSNRTKILYNMWSTGANQWINWRWSTLTQVESTKNLLTNSIHPRVCLKFFLSKS